MSRYVILHKLSRGFKDWDYHGSYDVKRRETVPNMTSEFIEWYQDNANQIKNVHSEKMVELDRTLIAFEFYNEEDALMCMLRFA
jgi:hypothetical protein